MQSNKYPFLFYMGGDPLAASAVAQTEQEEVELRAAGYRNAYDFPPAEVDPKAEASAVAAEMAQQAEMTEAEKKAELLALREEAKSLGLEFHHRTGADTIRAAIEKKRLEG